MGIKEMRKTFADISYEQAKPMLRQHNGYTHVIVFNLHGAIADKLFGCDERVTTALNQIIVGMQKDGYEIIDIKMSVLENQGTFMENTEGYKVLIIYK